MSTTIKYAGYGIWNSTVDITAYIQSKVTAGTTSFQASNNLVNQDPSVGNVKALFIFWQISGDTTVYSGVVAEHTQDSITIQAPAQK